jgi:hypothetical protein
MIIHFPKKTRETFFLDHLSSVILWTFLLVLVSYLFLDISVAQYFQHLHQPLENTSEVLTNLIDPKYQLFVWPILFFLFRFFLKKEIWSNRCLLLMISIALSNFFTEILKKLLGRARPELCGALACLYPRLTLPFVLLGLTLAFTRVILSQHFLSDIVAGFVIGILIAQWIYRVMQKERLSLRGRFYGTSLQ